MTYSSHRSASAAYNTTQQSLPPVETAALLLDGVVGQLLRAKQAFAGGRLDEEFNALQKASGILTGLRSMLDMKEGAEIAANLDRYYGALALLIVSIPNRRDTPDLADRLADQARRLRDAWRTHCAQPPREGVETRETSATPPPVPGGRHEALSA